MSGTAQSVHVCVTVTEQVRSHSNRILKQTPDKAFGLNSAFVLSVIVMELPSALSVFSFFSSLICPSLV